VKHSPGFLQIVTEAKKGIRECTIADVKARRDRGESFHFIDVREDAEFAADRAAGARHIGRGVLERDIETLIPDKDADIVLYCGGGFRSALAAESLQKMGYRRVVSMDGGMRAWREAGFPIDKDDQKNDKPTQG
jgi:rhodanese-related sulfurtransferase